MPNEIAAWVDWKYPRHIYVPGLPGFRNWKALGRIAVEPPPAIDPGSPLGDRTSINSYSTRQARKRAKLAFAYGKPEETMLDLTKKYRTREGREVRNLRRIGDSIEGMIVEKSPFQTGESLKRYQWDRNGWCAGVEKCPVSLVPACDPIVLDRKYKTAKGEPVELFKIADGRAWGRFHCMMDGYAKEWVPQSWDVNDHTLVPAVRKEKRVYWLRNYDDGSALGFSDEASARYHGGYVITGPHEIEIEIAD